MKKSFKLLVLFPFFLHLLLFLHDLQAKDLPQLEAAVKSDENQHIIDSLEDLLNYTTGIKKVEILLDIGSRYSEINISKSLVYTKQALALAEELGHKPSIAACLYDLGYGYSILYDQKKALDHFIKALKINHELADSSDESIAMTGNKGISKNLYRIGRMYLILGNYKKPVIILYKS